MIGFGFQAFPRKPVRLPIPDGMTEVMFRPLPGHSAPIIKIEGWRCRPWLIVPSADRREPLPEKTRVINIVMVTEVPAYIEVFFG